MRIWFVLQVGVIKGQNAILLLNIGLLHSVNSIGDATQV